LPQFLLHVDVTKMFYRSRDDGLLIAMAHWYTKISYSSCQETLREKRRLGIAEQHAPVPEINL
jgi:hypothetical protein